MCPVRRCSAVWALLSLLVVKFGSALPAEPRLDERDAEAALEQVVDSIRERLMRELGVTDNKPELVSTVAGLMASGGISG